MKTLIFLTTFTVLTTLLLISSGIKTYNTHLESQKDLIDKATPINGRIDVEFLEGNFGPADEQ